VFSGDLYLVQGFTSDRTLLSKAVDPHQPTHHVPMNASKQEVPVQTPSNLFQNCFWNHWITCQFGGTEGSVEDAANAYPSKPRSQRRDLGHPHFWDIQTWATRPN